ncbi:MAG: DUF4278 domain-containing protein [Pleurocapsa sp. MO_192.B19]|nr:DUF4278 domain-containing protein [Pleurocapsa sp. MO_192.B19]
MKLTYRGINYQIHKTAVEPKQFDSAINLAKYRISNHHDSNKVILIRPIHYYTYRGVSYTKHLIFDTKTELLLDINRQS